MNLKKKIMPFVMLGICTAAANAAPSIGTPANSPPSPHQFSVGLTTNYYHYNETVHGKFFVSDKGYMLGGIFNYIYNTKNKYFIGTEFDLSGGYANYNSRRTGSCNNVKHLKGETRLKIGKIFLISDSTTLSPYTGFGVRYKSDYSGGQRSTTGHHGYHRDSAYLYLPVGLKMTHRLSADWTMESFGEFDIFLGGRNRSKYTSRHINTHKQKKGYGVRGAVEFIKPLGKDRSISFGPYINYWNIKDSKKNHHPNGRWSVEPHNTTLEAGLGIKYRF